jgi:hypothetical protein
LKKPDREPSNPYDSYKAARDSCPPDQAFRLELATGQLPNAGEQVSPVLDFTPVGQLNAGMARARREPSVSQKLCGAVTNAGRGRCESCGESEHDRTRKRPPPASARAPHQGAVPWPGSRC